MLFSGVTKCNATVSNTEMNCDTESTLPQASVAYHLRSYVPNKSHSSAVPTIQKSESSIITSEQASSAIAESMGTSCPQTMSMESGTYVKTGATVSMTEMVHKESAALPQLSVAVKFLNSVYWPAQAPVTMESVWLRNKLSSGQLLSSRTMPFPGRSRKSKSSQASVVSPGKLSKVGGRSSMTVIVVYHSAMLPARS